MLKNESKILNKLFVNNLFNLIEKYNKMDEIIVEKLEDLVEKVDENYIKDINIIEAKAIKETIKDYF